MKPQTSLPCRLVTLGVVGSTALLGVLGNGQTAQAAIFSFDVAGTVTALSAGGYSFTELNGDKIGDPVAGQFSYDDSVALDDPNEFALTSLSWGTLANPRGVVNLAPGTYNRETGEFNWPKPGPMSFFPVFFQANTQTGEFVYGIRSTSVTGTFTATPSLPKSTPEPATGLSLVGLGLAAVLWRTIKTGSSKH